MILLTGATGYVGAALRAALERRFIVAALTRAEDTICGAPPGEWVHWDMSSGDDLPEGVFDRVSRSFIAQAWRIARPTSATTSALTSRLLLI